MIKQSKVCETQKDLMDEFLEEKLEGMRLRHFLNHVARCDNCLVFILEKKGLLFAEQKQELVQV